MKGKMKQLVFATNNAHKVDEVRDKLHGLFEIRTLSEIGCVEDIPETADTLQGNAAQKSHYLYERYHCDCFADDTGLEVEALNGAPGVYSARYAGPSKDSEANIDKLLSELDYKIVVPNGHLAHTRWRGVLLRGNRQRDHPDGKTWFQRIRIRPRFPARRIHSFLRGTLHGREEQNQPSGKSDRATHSFFTCNQITIS